ncbi:hypothetical protein BV25DRAFT_1897244 [Artomyces pyxidatus]|uniref:Uncharacterized protein n=1 Tax=Artomyces pyxidatus TaxID=48021 RepID=A0ACB8TF10_9AGAM|nr:hypothetical protein BV25DRAFT_1897244 [Artomyces pyxidatus]
MARYRKLTLKVRNANRKTQSAHKKINNHQRITKLIANNNIRGLHRLLAVSLRNGAGTNAIIRQIERSVDGLYSPRGGFSDREYAIAYLAKSLGGPFLLNALYKAEGYPSVSTVAQRYRIPRLMPSSTTPSRHDMESNVTSFFGPDGKQAPTQRTSGLLPGLILQVDGVALEERCRYDAPRNCIVGLCREHSHTVSTRVTDVEAIKAVEKALHVDETCCYGKDGTVVAIAPYADSQSYTPYPVILSPSCKTEKGSEMSLWMKTMLDVWRTHPHGEVKHGPIYAIGSDGESSFRLARFTLCMSETLDAASELGQILYKLQGLNRETGPYGIIGTCDPKHVIKRFATLLRSPSGILIHGTIITPTHVLANLAALPHMSKVSANELMNPADKQNVPKAVNLVQELNRLDSLGEPANPSELHRREVTVFLAKTLDYFVLPFISIEMSLSEQVQSLSTYAHLAAAMYFSHGLSFLTGALYADSQAIVKNIMFCIARLQLVDQDLEFFIIHEGTDRLEGIFSNCRTQDHARNFDTLELAQKLSVGAAISLRLEQYPDLDRGHRRLALKDAKGVDHVNPKSWKGDTRVGQVALAARWIQGRNDANHLLEDHFGSRARVDFNEKFSEYGRDLLRPNGTYVGSSYDPGNARENPPDTDTESEPAPDASGSASDLETAGDAPNGGENGTDFDDVPEGMDIEDFLEAKDDETSERQAERFLTLDGKKYLKSSVVAAFLTSKRARKVTMRTLRARGVTVEDLRRGDEDWNSDELDKEDLIKVGDVAGTLVRTEDRICLAVIEILGFEIQHTRRQLAAISINELDSEGDKAVTITAQIMDLTPHGIVLPNLDTEPLDTAQIDGSWTWTNQYVRFGMKDANTDRATQKQFIVRIPGVLLYPLGPQLVRDLDMDRNASDAMTWSLSHKQLVETLDQSWAALHPETEEIIGNVEMLPLISNSKLPYCETSASGAVIPHLVVLDVPAHMTAEKLSGDAKIGIDPCGWCGRDGSGCMVQLTKKGASRKISSSCRYHFSNMIYGQAIKTTKNSPCTNVPIHCPLCPVSMSGQPRTIWKYNAVYHLSTEHAPGDGDENLPKFPVEFLVDTFISSKEAELMRVEAAVTRQWRKDNRLADSDDMPEMRDALKRERAASAIASDRPTKTVKT